ncbi:MAG: STAS domain-containing protein [bacterium]|nr:STAS domain-containing protein [bacterium]
MFDSKITGNNDTGTLTLNGDLTIQNSDQLKDALQDAVSRFSEIIVCIESVENVDFSCFQLLCAAHKSAAKQEKSLAVVPPPGDEFMKLLEYSGLARYNEDIGYETRGFTVKMAGDRRTGGG